LATSNKQQINWEEVKESTEKQEIGNSYPQNITPLALFRDWKIKMEQKSKLC